LNPILGRWDFDRKPLLVFWETTKACLLVCKHCRANAILKALPGELTTEEGYKLIDQIAEFGRPTPILVFTGGDPLMRKDLFDLIRHGREVGVNMAAAPSVTPLLTRETAKRLVESGIGSVSLSLDSPWEEVHDDIRGVKGTYRKTLEAAKWFLDLGARVQINTTVMRETLESLPYMPALLHDLGVKTWEVFYFVPTGRGQLGSNLQPWEWMAVSFFLVEASRYGILVRTTEGPFFRVAACLEAHGVSPEEVLKGKSLELYQHMVSILRNTLGEPSTKPRAHTVGTRDGRGIVFIGYNGNVYPSGFLPVSAGNIRVKPLKEIYQNSRLFRMLREGTHLKGRCGKCEFKHLCGGSRARAYAILGDPFEEDPACAYIPGSFREVAEKCGLKPVLHARK